MSFLNIEIKARCHNPEEVEAILFDNGADYHGLDHQIDTYFRIPKGRLKLREGNIEHALIHYERKDQSGPKSSHVTLYKPNPGPALKSILTKSMGILTVVDKQRKIFFLKNVKFHIDDVKDLGAFVEIEAIDTQGTIGIEKLQEQCNRYINILKIKQQDLISQSYSDLLLKGHF